MTFEMKRNIALAGWLLCALVVIFIGLDLQVNSMIAGGGMILLLGSIAFLVNWHIDRKKRINGQSLR